MRVDLRAPARLLAAHPWSLGVGAGSVWVTPNGADGRLVRVDARTGRVSAGISAHPLYFGSVLAFGAGFVFTGNDDERTGVGPPSRSWTPGPTVWSAGRWPSAGPQSIAFGEGAVWVADHAGWLVKIDPRTLRVAARQRLDFGPHGVVALPVGPIYPAAGAGSIWSASRRPGPVD